jgi:hypothetical protein
MRHACPGLDAVQLAGQRLSMAYPDQWHLPLYDVLAGRLFFAAVKRFEGESR